MMKVRRSHSYLPTTHPISRQPTDAALQFRRSMKSEKDSRPHHISIPPKDAIAIVPPKKVLPRTTTVQAVTDAYAQVLPT